MTAPCFRLRDLTFGYESGPTVLREVSLELPPGERVALLGANGSGKTTLLHLMVGLLTPQSGCIEAFGRPRLTEADFHEVRRRAGLLFQDPDDQLFCPTVAEDVAFGPLNMGMRPDQIRETVARTLACLGLAGYEDRITYKLSGGEKRLVSLATVLAMEPDVLLLDEPTAGLDEPTRERITELLRGLPQAMLVVSHDRPFLRAVTQWAGRLDNGRLTLCDPA
jgi:cobalt/nickel transport system ATP-binding protein